jgi:hypothetical protein
MLPSTLDPASGTAPERFAAVLTAKLKLGGGVVRVVRSKDAKR